MKNAIQKLYNAQKQCNFLCLVYPANYLKVQVYFTCKLLALLPRKRAKEKRDILGLSLKIVQTSITYLGHTPNYLHALNYPLLISKILQKKILYWHGRPPSFLGHHLVKMMGRIRLLNPLQIIPFLFQHRDVKVLISTFQALYGEGKNLLFHW